MNECLPLTQTNPAENCGNANNVKIKHNDMIKIIVGLSLSDCYS